MAFDAFISYSHADGGRLASALQRGLHQLARPWWKLRALRVFRDDTALSVNPHLWESITSALDDAEWFVLLASPAAAQSDWVNREIEHWLTTKPVERILPVLTDGEWDWDPERGDFTEGSTAVPPSLRGRFSNEPRHLDLRWAQSEVDLNLRHSRFRDAVADVAAPMHHVAKDELEGEDVRQHRRAVRLARGATSVLVLLVVLSLTLGVVALQQRTTARRESRAARASATEARTQADAALSRELALQSRDALRDGHIDAALLLAATGYEREANDTATASLLSALTDQPALVKELHGLSTATSAIAFSPDASMVAAETVDGVIRIWDVASGRPLAHEPAASPGTFGNAVAFADDGKLLVTAVEGLPDAGETLQVWDVATGKRNRTIQTELAWATSAHGTTALVSTTDSLDVVDLRTGKQRASIATGSASAVAVSDDGALVAGVDTELDPSSNVVSDVARVWNAGTGAEVGSACMTRVGVQDPKQTSLLDLRAFFDIAISTSPPRVTYASAATPESGSGYAGTRSVCDLRSGVVQSQALRGRPDTFEYVSAVSADGRTYATRSLDGTMELIDSASGRVTTDSIPAPWNQGKEPPQGTVVFSPDGAYVSATQNDGTVSLWRTHPQPALARRSRARSSPSTDPISDPSGRVRLISGTDANGPTVEIRDAQTGRSIAHLEGSAYSASFSSNGRRLVAPTGNGMTVFDLATRRSREVVTPDRDCRTAAVSMAPGGNLAVMACVEEDQRTTADITRVRVVDLSTNRIRVGPAATIGGPGCCVDAITFSPDARLLAAYGTSNASGSLQIFARNGLSLRAHPIHQEGGPATVAWAPDSTQLIWGRGDGRITLVRISGARETLTDLAPPGSSGDVGVTAFSPDGKLVAVATGNGVRIWTLDDLAPLGILPDRSGPEICCYTTLRFSAGDNALTAGFISQADNTPPFSYTSVTTRWDLDPRYLLHQACAIANRNFTPAEWSRYLGRVPYQRTCAGFG